SCARQTLAHGKRRNSYVVKPVQAVFGRDPDVAFAVFKEGLNAVACEAVPPRKHVTLPMVYVQKALSHRPNPQTALPVAEQSVGLELPHCTGDRIGFVLSGDEPSESN